MKSQLFGQRRQQKGREGGLSYAEFLNLYGSVLDDLEPLALELAKAGITLGSGHPKDLEAEVNAEFAARVAALQQKIKDTVEKQHMGGFDGNVKRVVADTYGPDSDIAMKYGDQEENALCLILPGQAMKVSAIKLVAEFLGVTTPPATPKAVKPMLEAARVKINVAETERKANRETTRPTRRDDEKQSDFLKRLAAYNTAGKSNSSEFGEVKRAINWLTKWVEGRKSTPAGGQAAPEPPKNKKDELREKIVELNEQMTSLRGRITPTTPVSDLIQATSRMKEIESELMAAKAELETVEVSERENARLNAAATVVATAPPKPGEATGTMPGGVHEPTAQKKEIEPETLEEVVSLITKLEAEFTSTMAAADRHYADATALYAEAEKLRAEGKRGASGAKNVDGAKLEEKGAKAKQATEKIRLRVDALLNKKTELEKAAAKTAAATPLAAEKKKVRLAGRKPAPEPVVATPSTVTQDGNDPKVMIAREIARHATEGNTAMVQALTETLKALG